MKHHVREEKLGGWPSWIQGEEYPICPYCERIMRLVYQQFMDDGEIRYVFHCVDHVKEFKLLVQND